MPLQTMTYTNLFKEPGQRHPRYSMGYYDCRYIHLCFQDHETVLDLSFNLAKKNDVISFVIGEVLT